MHYLTGASQVVLVVNNLPSNAGDAGDTGLIPGLGRSPGGEHGYPLQYSCLENGQRSLVGYSLVTTQGRSWKLNEPYSLLSKK